MGNETVNVAFYDSDGQDDGIDAQNNTNNDNDNDQQYNYSSDPSEHKEETDLETIGTDQSQNKLNLHSLANNDKFEQNAIQHIPPENHIDDINQIFKCKKEIGQGRSSKVLLAIEKIGDQKTCALKELNRKHQKSAELFLREVSVLESLQHPNIVALYDIYLDTNSYFISTAYYSGGEFFHRIIKIRKFSEKRALKYIKPILNALSYMHSKGIVHRDLKPSNMVFDKKGKNGTIKLIDFGTSEFVIDNKLYAAKRIGTLLYTPPEWEKDRIGLHIKKGDMWALGVILYVLMVGRLPFDEWKQIEQYKNNLVFPETLKRKLSYEFIHFIERLLENDADERMSVQEALKHRWVSQCVEKQKDYDLGVELKDRLKLFMQSKNYDKKQREIAFDNITNHICLNQNDLI